MEFYDFVRESFYYVIHFFTGCKEEDMNMIGNIKGTCRKCGRHHFFFRKYE